MSTTYKVLSSDTCGYGTSESLVVQIGEDGPDSIVDYGGAIQKYTREKVKISDTHTRRT